MRKNPCLAIRCLLSAARTDMCRCPAYAYRLNFFTQPGMMHTPMMRYM